MHTGPGWQATYGLIELHLLLQVQADDAVVVIDPVTVEVIHLGYDKKQDVSQSPRLHTTPGFPA